MLALTSDDGSQSVLRLMTEEPWRRHADGLLSRESLVQTQLADSDVPAPRSIALDARGEQTGVPAHLMSYLPGALELDRGDDGQVEALAALLTRIHAIDPADGGWPRSYQSWAWPEKRIVPVWSDRPALWRRAFAVLDGEPPTYEPTFLHRDFHPGNVLFDGGTITGVVDWVETSWGPAELDVAHCSTALSLLHGTDAAKDFRDEYRSAGGTLGDDRHWWLIDAVGFLPDPEKVAAPWRQSGRPDLAARLARRRLEAHLGWVLDEPLN